MPRWPGYLHRRALGCVVVTAWLCGTTTSAAIVLKNTRRCRMCVGKRTATHPVKRATCARLVPIVQNLGNAAPPGMSRRKCCTAEPLGEGAARPRHPSAGQFPASAARQDVPVAGCAGYWNSRQESADETSLLFFAARPLGCRGWCETIRSAVRTAPGGRPFRNCGNRGTNRGVLPPCPKALVRIAWIDLIRKSGHGDRCCRSAVLILKLGRGRAQPAVQTQSRNF